MTVSWVSEAQICTIHNPWGRSKKIIKNYAIRWTWHASGDPRLLPDKVLLPLILIAEESFAFPCLEDKGVLFISFFIRALFASRLCARIIVQVLSDSKVEWSGVWRHAL